MRKLHCEILTPEKQYFKGDVSHVTVEAEGGSLGIFPMHAPLLTTIKKEGRLRIFSEPEQMKQYSIDEGILQVEKDQLRVMALKVEEV